MSAAKLSFTPRAGQQRLTFGKRAYMTVQMLTALLLPALTSHSAKEYAFPLLQLLVATACL